MDVTQLNNIRFSMVQNNAVSINSTALGKVNNLSSSSSIKQDRVEMSSHTNSFLTNITSKVQHISNLQTLQQETISQLDLVKNFGQLISSVVKGSLDSYQGEVQNFIKTFNSQSQSSIQRIERIIEEKESEESRTYFDGILGAKPLSREEISQAIEQQQQRLEHINQTLNDEIIKTIDEVQNSFTQEKENNTKTNPLFSTVDFEQESKTFTKESFQSYSNAMIEIQTNVEPIVGEKLLAS
jgi:hypothetical protein